MTLLAWWRHEVTRSPARERVVRALQEHPTLADLTPLERVGPLSTLYAGRHADGAEALLDEHFHPAAPFPPPRAQRTRDVE